MSEVKEPKIISVNGLTQHEWDSFYSLIKQANDEQLERMQHRVDAELFFRHKTNTEEK